MGRIVMLAAEGDQDAMDRVASVFGAPYHTLGGWQNTLGRLHTGTVAGQLRAPRQFWSVGSFHALYVACWIHHPVEKGTFMISLTDEEGANVTDACKRLLKAKEMTKRVSSHMGKKGYSASQGWNFLAGYGELLVQIETGGARPYLFLKTEGHALSLKDPAGAGKHLLAWGKKIRTGEGEMANPALNDWATVAPNLVERRAAENYSLAYKALLKKLKLKGKLVTVAEVVAKLCQLVGSVVVVWKYNLAQVSGDAHLLGQAMLDPDRGFLNVFRLQKGVLQRQNIDYTDEVNDELTRIAQRMVATPTPHPEQVFNEVRVTPADVDQSLYAFRTYIT